MKIRADPRKISYSIPLSFDRISMSLKICATRKHPYIDLDTISLSRYMISTVIPLVRITTLMPVIIEIIATMRKSAKEYILVLKL